MLDELFCVVESSLHKYFPYSDIMLLINLILFLNKHRVTLRIYILLLASFWNVCNIGELDSLLYFWSFFKKEIFLVIVIFIFLDTYPVIWVYMLSLDVISNFPVVK